MKFAFCCALAATAVVSLAGCNKAASLERVNADVAKAARSASADDAKAEQQQAKAIRADRG